VVWSQFFRPAELQQLIGCSRTALLPMTTVHFAAPTAVLRHGSEAMMESSSFDLKFLDTRR
jgi:hypothetical protein